MTDIRCSRDGWKCDNCPIIKECEHIELTEEIDAYSLYEKGKVAGIDDLVRLVCKYYTMQERAGYYTDTNNMIKQRIADFGEQLKEQI